MIKELQLGDWISINWTLPYKFYILKNDDTFLTVACPSWRANDSMRFAHWEFNYLNGKCWKFLGKSKPNPLYNTITKLTGFIHPVVLIEH